MHLADAVVEAIRHVQDGAIGRHGDAERFVEARGGARAVGEARRARAGERRGLARCNVDGADPVVAVIRHVDGEAVVRGGDARRVAEARGGAWARTLKIAAP